LHTVLAREEVGDVQTVAYVAQEYGERARITIVVKRGVAG